MYDWAYIHAGAAAQVGILVENSHYAQIETMSLNFRHQAIK